MHFDKPRSKLSDERDLPESSKNNSIIGDSPIILSEHSEKSMTDKTGILSFQS